MHKDFKEPPKTREEIGLRLDYLRSEGELKGMHGPVTIGEAAKLVGTSVDEVAASKKFFDHDRRRLS